MKTVLDCLPCLYKQALYTAKLCTDSKSTQRLVLDKAAEILTRLDLNVSPPENSIAIYQAVAQLCGVADPFKSLKDYANLHAAKLANVVTEKISSANDPLLAAIKFAIAGNVIDYGSHQDFNIDQTISACLDQNLAINHYPQLCNSLEKANTILYLGDNAGELVFDRLLIKLLQSKVYFAVKEQPIINDALTEDAFFCGLNEDCEIVSNGTNCPGTPINKCSPEFTNIFHTADLIISKGQGNFETLSEVNTPIFFLMTVKCPVVGKHAAEIAQQEDTIKVGDAVLFTNLLDTKNKA